MRKTPMSLLRWLTAANIVFITPKMPPTDMMTVTMMIDTRNCRFVCDRLSKYSVSV